MTVVFYRKAFLEQFKFLIAACIMPKKDDYQLVRECSSKQEVDDWLEKHKGEWIR